MTNKIQNTEGAKNPDTQEEPPVDAPQVADTEGAKNPDTQEVGKEAAAFFATNPNAKSVLKVGTTLFLSHQIGAARDFANRNGLTVELVKNPNLGEVTEATDMADDGEA